MPSTAKLWVVATPIGHTADLSPRACEILASVYMVLAEDTRRAARLLRDVGIPQIRLLSFFDHNEESRLKQVMEVLDQGHQVALISDAGTPLLADPGYRLVRLCRARGIPVSAVPGPCAPVVALSAAGIPPLPFTFLGFLPRSRGDRVAIFEAYGGVPATLVFFERKDRACESLAIAYEVLGDRELAICRELTKTHEEFICGTLAQASALATGLLGELTIVIGPPQTVLRLSADEVLRRYSQMGSSAEGVRAQAKALAKDCPGWTAKEIYALLMTAEPSS